MAVVSNKPIPIWVGIEYNQPDTDEETGLAYPDGWYLCFKGMYLGPNPDNQNGYRKLSDAIIALEKWAEDRNMTLAEQGSGESFSLRIWVGKDKK